MQGFLILTWNTGLQRILTHRCGWRVLLQWWISVPTWEHQSFPYPHEGSTAEAPILAPRTHRITSPCPIPASHMEPNYLSCALGINNLERFTKHILPRSHLHRQTISTSTVKNIGRSLGTRFCIMVMASAGGQRCTLCLPLR